MAAALSGNDDFTQLYKLNVDEVDAAKEYLANGGTVKKYTEAYCKVISVIKKSGMTNSKSNCAVAAIKAGANIDEGTYNAMGITSDKDNIGYGLDKFGYSLKDLEKHSMQLLLYDEDRSGGISKKEVVAYIDSLGLSLSEEKSCLFAYLKDAKINPYGSIPNYLGFGNTSSSGGGVGYGRSKSTKEKTVKEKHTKCRHGKIM